jgi:adenylylsulfate kinase-like enzyme
MSKTLNIVESTLKTSTVAELFSSKGIISIVPRIRENSNQYPYVTLINGDNEAENVYFSKEASKLVAAGEPILKGFFDKYQVGYVTNELGEERIKFISNSARVSIADIL